MTTIYIDTISRDFYNEEGALLPSGHPSLAYKRKEKIAFQLCEGTGTGGAPDTWPKNTSFNRTGITALLSLDNDFVRRHSGTLQRDLQPGQTELIAKIDAKSTDIPPKGILRVFTQGETRSIAYNSFTSSNTVYTFALADAATTTIPAENTMDIPDALYAQAVMLSPESKPAEGLFVFELNVFSSKLRAAMEYNNIYNLSTLAGLELLLFVVGAEETTVLDSFLCKTVSLHGTIAEANPNAQIPDTQKDAFVGLISAEIAKQLQSATSGKANNVFISEDAEHYAGTDVENAIIDLQNQINDMPTGGGGSGSVEAGNVWMSQTAGQYAGDNVQNAIVDLAEICNGLIEQVESINLALAAAETELESI